MTAEQEIFLLLRQVCQLGVDAGFTSDQLTRMLRVELTHVAARQLLRRGLPKLTFTDIAVATGIPRQEVAKLFSEKRESDVIDSTGFTSTFATVRGWRSDKDFLSKTGEPMALAVKSTRGFVELARRYAGDVTAKSVLRDLLAKRLVRVAGGSVSLLNMADSDTNLVAQARNATSVAQQKLLSAISTDYELRKSKLSSLSVENVVLRNLDTKTASIVEQRVLRRFRATANAITATGKPAHRNLRGPKSVRANKQDRDIDVFVSVFKRPSQIPAPSGRMPRRHLSPK